MTIIVTAQARSTAPPEAFFARWADMGTWPEWNSDTEWVRLDGPFAQGATGTLKPKGGPKVRFVVRELTQGRVFVDDSKLVGAHLVFDHRVTVEASGTRIDVTVSLKGPLRWVWARLMGKGLRAGAAKDLDALVATAESDVRLASQSDSAAGQSGSDVRPKVRPGR